MSKKKHLDTYDLSLSGHKPVQLRNAAQRRYWQALKSAEVVFGIGPAGTGKTFLAASYAIEELVSGRIEKVILTRATVPIEGEEIGFLPGTLEKKMEPWTAEIFDVFKERVGVVKTMELLKAQSIQIVPFAFMRGRTFKNAIVIADEMQNATEHQAKALVTRVGEGTRMFINGDPDQSDLMPPNGLDELVDMVDAFNLPFPVIQFTESHVVRSETCRIWVEAFMRRDGHRQALEIIE